MQKLLWIILLVLMVPLSYAATFFYCTNTSTYVYPGDTLSHVKQVCGTPLSETESVSADTKMVEIERWVYLDRRKTSSGIGGEKYRSILVVDFVDKKIAKMSLDGGSVTEIPFCRERIPLSIGMKQGTVFQQCGSPMQKETLQQKQSDRKVLQKVLTYQPNPYQPAVKLYFEQNKLVKIQ